MTARAKIAVSVPQELVEAAREAVRAGRASSVSAYVADAMAARVRSDDLDGLLAELLAETGGPMTAAERRRVDRAAGWR